MPDPGGKGRPVAVNIFVAGASSSMARPFLELLSENPACEKIVGIDVKPPKDPVPKMTFHTADIRDPGLSTLMKGCEAVVDFAFVVAEIRDKDKTHDINLNGSINVFQSAARAGVRKIVYISSIAAYGSHPDNPVPLTEEMPLRGNEKHESFYSWGKREVELYLDGFAREHPEIVVTRLRSGIVVGPRANPMLDQLFGFPVFPVALGKEHPYQLVHERDIAQAIHLATFGNFPGAFNIATDPPMPPRALARLAGKPAFPLHWGIACFIADLSFRLGLPWPGVSRETLKLAENPLVVSSRKAREVMKWEPRHTPEEAVVEYLRSRGVTPVVQDTRG